MNELVSEEIKAICKAGMEMKKHIESRSGKKEEGKLLIYRLEQLYKMENADEHVSFFLNLYNRYQLPIPKVLANCFVEGKEKIISAGLIFRMGLAGIESEH